jgi:hypothetical protein
VGILAGSTVGRRKADTSANTAHFRRGADNPATSTVMIAVRHRRIAAIATVRALLCTSA